MSDRIRAPEPTAQEIGGLWAEFKATASVRAREGLIIHYSPLVKFVAGRVGVGLPRNVEQSDLISYGMFGLIDAIDKFDRVGRGDPHWFAVQFMKTMQVDREAAKLLLGTMRDREDKHGLVDAFSMRTLVVCGSEDQDNGSAPELASILQDAEYAESPGTHMSSVTKPELGEEIARFLASA